ncbi:MAG: glycosyltransferase [bacterium]
MSPDTAPCRAAVVIPTWTRPDTAARAAAAAFEQMGPGDLLLVVAQGSEEEMQATREAVQEALGGTLPEGVRVDRQPEPDRTRARNRAFTSTGCRYAVFLDDDSIPRPGWLEALLAPLEEGEADLAAGRLVEEPDLTTNAPGLTGARLTWTGHTRRDFNTLRSGPTGLVPGGNMAVRCELARRAGGFDETFAGATMYEDVEFSLRLRRLGARAVYRGDAEVHHLALGTGSWHRLEAERWERVRARQMSLIFRRHRPWGWPLMALSYLAAAVRKSLIGRLPPAAVPAVARALLEGRRAGARGPEPLVEERA